MVIIMNKKEQILNAAVKLISERGFHNATTDTIAKEAGVASGTIYNYFKTKEEILGAIFERVYEQKKAFLEELRGKDIPFSEKLKAFLIMHFKDVQNDRCLAGLLVKEYHLGKEQEFSPIKKFLFGIAQEFEEMYIEAEERENMANLDGEIVSTAIFGAIQAITMKTVYSEPSKSSSFKEDKIIDNVIRLFCYGVYLEGK